MGRKLAACVTLLAVGACGGESASHRDDATSGHRAGASGAGAGTGAMGGTGGTSNATAGAGSSAPEAGGTAALGAGGTSHGGSAGAVGDSGPGGGSGGSVSAAGTGAGPAGGGTQGEAGAGGASTVAIDDVDHTAGEPMLPAASSGAFYWLYGLGNWFVMAPAPNPYVHDAQPDELDPPRGDNTKAYRVKDEGRASGVDLYAQLNHPEGRPVDLSAFAGVSFWARLEGSEQIKVGVNPGVSYFDASSDVPTHALAIAPEWRQFTLRFSELGADVHGVVSFDFIVGEGGDKFDFWLDDLGLFCDGPCPAPD